MKGDIAHGDTERQKLSVSVVSQHVFDTPISNPTLQSCIDTLWKAKRIAAALPNILQFIAHILFF